MNNINRMELHELRAGMLKLFLGVAKVPGDAEKVERYMELNDRHQEIIAGDSEGENENQIPERH